MRKPWKHLIDDEWGFDVKSNLNPKVWVDGKLNPKIKPRLTSLVNDFLGADSSMLSVEDITITGSLANYNWSKFSDIDLHIVADFGSDGAMKKKLFDYKRKIWNSEHDVKIEGFDVEIYVQKASEPHYSSGVYSVTQDKWLVAPKQMEEKSLDLRAIEGKANCVADRIKRVKELIDVADYSTAIDVANSIMLKLKNQRSAGLSSGGEFSVENLAFKLLRRRGDIGKLMSLKKEAYDCSKSINKPDCE